MRVEYSEIDNPVIKKIHRTIKQLKDQMYNGYPARYTYGSHEASYTFKIKLCNQKKALIFTVSKDPTVTTFQVNFLEKTRNLVEDIAQIYKAAKEPVFLEIAEISLAQLKRAFSWVIQPSDRTGEIFKAPVEAYPWNKPLKNDRLYYRVVKKVLESQELNAHDPVLRVDTPITIYKVEFADGKTGCCEVMFGGLKPTPGNLMISNYTGMYALMGYSTARKHMDFTSISHYDIVNQLELTK